MLNKSGRAISCARLTPDGRIERMAVLPRKQKSQIETALIEVLIDYAHQIQPVENSVAVTKCKVYSSRLTA